MHRTLSRLVSCGAFAALLFAITPAKSLAQRHQGCGGGGGGGCWYGYASQDYSANPYYPCALRTGTTSNTYHIDSQYEVVQLTGVTGGDVPGCNGSTCGRWLWEFDHMQGGEKYLRIKGHSLHNTYNVQYVFCDSTQACTFTYYYNAGSIGPGADQLSTIDIGNNGGLDRICVALVAQEPASCSAQDDVYIDLLMLTNGVSCATP